MNGIQLRAIIYPMQGFVNLVIITALSGFIHADMDPFAWDSAARWSVVLFWVVSMAFSAMAWEFSEVIKKMARKSQ